MRGLDPRIQKRRVPRYDLEFRRFAEGEFHDDASRRAWIRGSSPRMTQKISAEVPLLDPPLAVQPDSRWTSPAMTRENADASAKCAP
jgi:hypothetical protein